jgi:hypothetical protein
MKQNGISLNTLLKDEQISLAHLSEEEIGDEHAFTSTETPLRPDAFEKVKKKKWPSSKSISEPSWKLLGLISPTTA